MEIIRGMPEAEYRARPEISQSEDKYFLEPTPAHALWKSQNRKEIAEFGIGRALHGLALEEKKIFAIEPVADGRTSAGKAIKAAFAAENEGKIILTAAQGEAVIGMAAGILRNKGIVALLESATEREISLFWDGKKCRLDGICPPGVLDLKSTGKGADPWQFEKSIMDFGYHIQAARYLEGAALAGLPCENFIFIVCESFPPYEAALYTLSHEAIEVGRQVLDRLHTLLLLCRETGVYPGYSETLEEISIPAWAMKKGE